MTRQIIILFIIIIGAVVGSFILFNSSECGEYEGYYLNEVPSECLYTDSNGNVKLKGI